MSVRVVLDTFPPSPPVVVIDMILSQQLISVFSGAIIDEYCRVLLRPKFSFEKRQVEAIISVFQDYGICIVPVYSKTKFKDLSDKIFYDTALTGGVDYLITGNKKHFPRKKWIVSPEEFLCYMDF